MILFAIKSLNVVGGGAERVLVDVANGVARRGHSVEVLTFDNPGQAFYPLDPVIKRHDVAFNPPGLPMPRLGYLRAIPRIRSTLRAVRPDVLIAFMHSTYVPMALAAAGLNVPMIASEHTEARHYVGRPLQRILRQIVDAKVICRVVPSEATRQSFLAETRMDSIVIPNPVETGHFEPYITCPPEVPPVVVSVGRLWQEKGHAVLLRAFAAVAAAFPDWRLRLVGEGPLRTALEAQVAALGLQGRVEMPGATRDVAQAYVAARFVVLPSRYESFGMVAAEALAAGRPVLAFDDCAGVAEIVADGVNGLLVRGHNDDNARAKSMSEGLRQLMADPALCARLGRTGPGSVRRFGLEPVLDRWEAVIDRALREGRAA